MDMNEFLSKELIILDLKATSKADAIQKLCERLYAEDCITDVDKFVADVYEREAEGETGIGQGIAIPHGKSENVLKTSLAIGRTETIDWEGEEHQEVTIIILFAVRLVDNTSVHLKLLSQVASKLAHDESLEMLKTAKNAEDIINIFVD
ncbi:MAG: PTS sugar transporter subunit IIA [Carnobacterium sp.]|uniref:PTS sugar transporter subunit IIA n=1 Tax=Carnobacterium sp. TaxID=48221 RepID=UPI0033149DE9